MFRTWRRSRPFWGGLLILLAGLEMLLIPVTGVLARGQIKLVIYVGIGGIFGILIGALLVACALALWFNHANKTFYSIAAVLLSILSFIGTNLGGFFIGMLLGIVGGSLAFAWTPTDEAQAEDFRPRPAGPRSEGVGLVLGEQPDDDTLDYDAPTDAAHRGEATAGHQARGRDEDDRDGRSGGPEDNTRSARPYLAAPTGPRHRGHGGSRAMALVAISALAAGTLFSLAGGRASAAEIAPAQSQASQGCILFVICTPSPSSSPTPSPPSS
ncbi:MAG TPA: DUF6114 domain-containing protein, partial [Streptosporangiaceae bacterium]